MKTFKDKNGNVLGTFLEQGDTSGGGGALYNYYITFEVTDGTDTATLNYQCVSTQVFAEFGSDETPTITVEQLMSLIPTNCIMIDANGTSGSNFPSVGVDNNVLGIGGWTSFTANDITVKELSRIEA